MKSLVQKLYADVMAFDGKKEPELVRPCPVYQEGWPMDLCEMLIVNEVEYVLKMGLAIDLGEVDCKRRSSAASQPVVVALLMLKQRRG